MRPCAYLWWCSWRPAQSEVPGHPSPTWSYFHVHFLHAEVPPDGPWRKTSLTPLSHRAPPPAPASCSPLLGASSSQARPIRRPLWSHHCLPPPPQTTRQWTNHITSSPTHTLLPICISVLIPYIHHVDLPFSIWPSNINYFLCSISLHNTCSQLAYIHMHSSISTTASCGMLSISVNDLQTTAFGTWRDGAAIRCFFFGDTPTSAMAISDSQNENCNTSCTKTLHTCTFAACAGISNQLASSRSLIACNPSWTILLYLAGMFQKKLRTVARQLIHDHPDFT